MRTSALFLAVLLLATACRANTAGTETSASSDAASTAAGVTVVPTTPQLDVPTPTPEPTTTSTGESSTPTSDLDVLVARLIETYPKAAAGWPGFNPSEHPTVLVQHDANDAVTGAITIAFPKPEALGNAELLADHPATGMVHRITELDPAVRERLASVEAFEFNRMVADVDSFVMIAGGSDPFFAIADEQYTATLLHEMFHRYQFSDFAETAFVDQDVEGYDYSETNLELAMLEEAALKRAVLAEPGSAAQTEAARWVAAIRQLRLDRDQRVRLDASQERYEGTARWIEHLLDISTAKASAEGFAENVFAGAVRPSAGVKDYFGFGRWYASGAALVELARMLGIDDVVEQIEAGANPAAIIADHVALSPDDADALVEAARTELDPDGAFAKLAAEMTAGVADEPPVFGDEDHGDHAGEHYDDHAGEHYDDHAGEHYDDHAGEEYVDGDGDVVQGEPAAGDDAQEITDAQFQCLVDGGLDLSSGEVEVDPDLAAECFGDG